jgi:nucleoside-diphosphate-sugar epimerase
MNIFMTGASGYVGGAIAGRLVAAGHRVHALSRSLESDARLRELGVDPCRCDLSALEVLTRHATTADAVVHAAIDYADPNFGAIDAPAVRALIEAVTERGAAMVYLSSTLVYGDTGEEVANEDRPPTPLVQAFKLDGERRTVAAGGMVLRPGLVHGAAGSALLDGMRAAAEQHGVVQYVGHGTNRWSVVHADDLAEAVRLALQGPQPGAVLNVADTSAPSMRAIAAAVATSHGVAAMPIAVEDARDAMGDFAEQLTRPLVVDAARARQVLAWRPRGPALLSAVDAAA